MSLVKENMKIRHVIKLCLHWSVLVRFPSALTDNFRVFCWLYKKQTQTEECDRSFLPANHPKISILQMARPKQLRVWASPGSGADGVPGGDNRGRESAEGRDPGERTRRERCCYWRTCAAVRHVWLLHRPQVHDPGQTEALDPETLVLCVLFFHSFYVCV